MESCHPTNDALERYLLGISQDDIPHLEEHLISCPDCVDQAEAVQSWIDSLRSCASSARSDSRLTVRIVRWTSPSKHRLATPLGAAVTVRIIVNAE